MSKYYYVLLCMLSCVTAGAQPPVIKWQTATNTGQPYLEVVDPGTPGEYSVWYYPSDRLKKLIPAPDGTYYGITNTQIYDHSEAKLVKFDATGHIIFTKLMNEYNALTCLIPATGGGYLIGGNAYERMSPYTQRFMYLLTKVDDNGTVVWQKKYRGTDNGFYGSFDDIIPSAEGGYIISGSGDGPAGNDKSDEARGGGDYWIVKIDPNGVKQWDRTIGGEFAEQNVRVAQLSNGNYVVAGQSGSNISGDKTEDSRGEYWLDDYWLVAFDQLGSLLWQKTLGGDYWESVGDLKATADGGMILGGYSFSDLSGDKTDNSRGGYDWWIIKLKANGVLEWQKTIGGDGDEYLSSIIPQADGTYLAFGSSSSGISGERTATHYGSSDYWAVRLGSTGSLQWQYSAGGSDGDDAASIVPLGNDSYVLAGYSWSSATGVKTLPKIHVIDNWLLKIGPCADNEQIKDTICRGTTYAFGGNQLSAAGVYTHKFTNQLGCDSTVELTLVHYAATSPLVAVQQAYLSVTGVFDNAQWLLNGGVIPGATGNAYTATQDGGYQFTYTTADGCRDSSAVARPILTTHLFVPNLFTPNNDSKNDVLKVYGNSLQSVSLTVFNQWGEKVFESRDQQQGWDGNYKGKPQPVGVYVYVVKAVSRTGEPLTLKRVVSLLR